MPDIIVGQRAADLAPVQEVIEMRYRLDQRQPVFALADRPLEQRGETGGGRTRPFGQQPAQTGERALVVLDHLPQPQRQAGERRLVAGQHQMVAMRERLEGAAALQPVGDRIGHRLGRIDAEIGRDRGQELIAAKDQLVILGPERRMVGRMPLADPHPPAPAAGHDPVALADPGEAQGQRMHAIGEVERAFGGSAGMQIGGHPGPAPEVERLGNRHRLLVKDQHPGKEPGSAGGHQLGAVRLQPARQADVVGVVMGDEDAGDGLARKPPVERRLQRGATGRGVDAGVDQRPAVAIVEGIGIDVVERHRQRKAQPQHALRNLNGLTRSRRIGPGVVQPFPRGPVAHALRSSTDSA
ncbi:hypothetical protein SDC9_12942 [bioreactor metagenome]|uniref:Uncharacterized protein n=1 Tax=bioreactor metagenome TaxID=1076179 RepID=A0A644TNF1_9ZZZZ